MIKGFKPTVEWLLDELWPDEPWVYSRDSDLYLCFWCENERGGSPGDKVRPRFDINKHRQDCPWRLVWEHKNLGPLEKNG